MSDWTGTPYEPHPVTGNEAKRHRGSWGSKGRCAWPYSAWCCCPSNIRLPYEPSRRDRMAHTLANAALRLASPTYRALLRGAYIGGLKHATECHPQTEAAS